MTATNDLTDAVPGAGPTQVEIETEMAVLGAALDAPVLATMLMDRLTAADFARPAHQVVYGLIVDVSTAGEEPSYLAVAQAAQRARDLVVMRYLPELLTQARVISGSAAFETQLGVVANYAAVRRMSQAGVRLADIAAGASADDLDQARDRVRELLDDLEAPADGPDADAITWDELYRRELERAEDPKEAATVPVPFEDLTRILNGGWRPGQLIVVGARPSIGKSLVAAEVCRHAALHDVRTLLVTLEMDHAEVSARLTSATAGVLLSKTVRMTEERDVLDDADWGRLARGYQSVAEHGHNLTIVNPRSGPFTTRSLERRLVAMQRKGTPYGLVVLDYLQLLESAGSRRAENRQVEVQQMSRELKLMAARYNVPIIVLAQLNRGPEQRQDFKPLMSDLRESGGLEQDANVVVLLHRPDAYEPEHEKAGEIDLIIAKNRNGPKGTVTAAFRGHYAAISDMAPAHLQEPPAGG